MLEELKRSCLGLAKELREELAGGLSRHCLGVPKGLPRSCLEAAGDQPELSLKSAWSCREAAEHLPERILVVMGYRRCDQARAAKRRLTSFQLTRGHQAWM